MTTDTKTDTLARLRELAQRAKTGEWFPHETSDTLALIDACDPQTILRLLDVIAAADAMRGQYQIIWKHDTGSGDVPATASEYDAARAALDKP